MTQAIRMALLLGTAASLLGACSSDGGAVSAGDMLVGMVEGVVSDDETQAVPQTVSRQRAAEVKYASIGVTIDDHPQILFPLANREGDDLLYTYGYTISLVIREGRVVRTQGLGRDMMGSEWQGEDIIRTAMTSRTKASGTRTFISSDFGIGPRTAHCTAEVVGDEAVNILEKPISARHVREECDVPELEWHFTNDFWIGPSNGQVWRSVQHIHPKVSPLTIETFRPAQRTPAS